MCVFRIISKDGKVIEEGNHRELMNIKGGLYHQLVEHQLEKSKMKDAYKDFKDSWHETKRKFKIS